jgi:hypothetical protein
MPINEENTSNRASSDLPDLPGTKVWCHSSEAANKAISITDSIVNLITFNLRPEYKNALIKRAPNIEYSIKWTTL